MNVSCLKENLRRGLAAVGRAVASRSPLPVLTNILVSTDEGRLKLVATDLEIGITTWIGAKVKEEGAITLPARLFTDIVGNLPNDTVSLTLDARTQSVRLECSRYTTNIKGMAADDFPSIPTVGDHTPTLVLPAGELRQAIGQVAFAAATDVSRPVLTGVLMRVGSGVADSPYAVTFAAADGYRLAKRVIPLPEGGAPSGIGQEVIVPARALSELARVIGDGEGEVVVTVTPTGGQVLFHTETTDLVSRLIDGTFPDFERIIPADYATRSVLETGELVKAVKLASLFATANQNFIKLTMEPGEEGLAPGQVIITANAADRGDNTGTLEGAIHGEGGQIAMNVKYLNDALAAMETPQVAIETQTPQHPGVFKPVGHDSYVHVIMPMTLR